MLNEQIQVDKKYYKNREKLCNFFAEEEPYGSDKNIQQVVK